jgi:hypothetical protein
MEIMNLNLIKHYLIFHKIWNKNNKSFKIEKEKLDGDKDKLKEVKFNKMLYLIHYKLYIVEIPCFL